jgi:hypothetical protein
MTTIFMALTSVVEDGRPPEGFTRVSSDVSGAAG